MKELLNKLYELSSYVDMKITAKPENWDQSHKSITLTLNSDSGNETILISERDGVYYLSGTVFDKDMIFSDIQEVFKAIKEVVDKENSSEVKESEEPEESKLEFTEAKVTGENTFSVGISGEEVSYEADSEDLEHVVNKINKWISKGADRWGGLYNWINRNFKRTPSESVDDSLYKDTVLTEETPEEEEEFIVDVQDNGDVNFTIKGVELDTVPLASVDTEEILQSLRDQIDEGTQDSFAEVLAVILRNFDVKDMTQLSEVFNAISLTAPEEDLNTDDSTEEPIDTEEPVEEPVEEPTDTEDTADDSNTEEPVGESLKEFGEVQAPDTQPGLGGLNLDSGVEIATADVEDDSIEGEEVGDSFVDKDEFLEVITPVIKDLDMRLLKITKDDRPDEELYLVGTVNPDTAKIEYLTYDDSDMFEELPITFDEVVDLDIVFDFNSEEKCNKVKDYLNQKSEELFGEEVSKIDVSSSDNDEEKGE